MVIRHKVTTFLANTIIFFVISTKKKQVLKVEVDGIPPLPINEKYRV